MTPEAVQRLFLRGDGTYHFARWARPIVPVVFGVEDATLSVVKGAIEAVVTLAGHKMAETDVELGANLMVFFLRDWAEVLEVPGLAQMIPDLGPLVGRLQGARANQYRLFRFDPEGAIRAAFVFLVMDGDLAALGAEELALAQMAQIMLVWAERAFVTQALLAQIGGRVILHPDVAAVIRAAYAPVLPDVARDPSHALRIAARIA